MAELVNPETAQVQDPELDELGKSIGKNVIELLEKKKDTWTIQEMCVAGWHLAGAVHTAVIGSVMLRLVRKNTPTVSPLKPTEK